MVNIQHNVVDTDGIVVHPVQFVVVVAEVVQLVIVQVRDIPPGAFAVRGFDADAQPDAGHRRLVILVDIRAVLTVRGIIGRNHMSAAPCRQLKGQLEHPCLRAEDDEIRGRHNQHNRQQDSGFFEDFPFFHGCFSLLFFGRCTVTACYHAAP